ncbi:MAG: glycosyltransferase family 2 protein [Candidatus Sumerlaeaceae bacterium]|nr:glycosyltransferase family 2 protein [Candidatus Sumerlaeaceae bacterium]
MKPEFSVIIPNWNGAAFLRRCLSATTISASASGLTHEIIVIDDASSDESVAIISNDFPNIRLIRNEKNVGFGASINKAVSLATAPLVVLLNNDLSPREQMLHELVWPLENDPGVFAVSGKTVDWYSGEPNHVNMFAKFIDGNFRLAYENSATLTETMFFQGGSCALRREQFLAFGGFSSIYHPGYWEDYDISYLALKSGWRILYNPKALAAHVGQGSMKRAYGAERIRVVKLRNRLLFQWVNFSDPPVVSASCRYLPCTLAHATAQANNAEILAFREALKKLPEVEKLRQARKRWWRFGDQELFARFANRGNLC